MLVPWNKISHFMPTDLARFNHFLPTKVKSKTTK